MNLKNAFNKLGDFVKTALFSNTSKSRTARFPDGYAIDGEVFIKPGMSLDYYLQSYGEGELSLEVRNESFSAFPVMLTNGSMGAMTHHLSIALGPHDEMRTLELFDDFNCGVKLDALFADAPSHPVWQAIIEAEKDRNGLDNTPSILPR